MDQQRVGEPSHCEVRAGETRVPLVGDELQRGADQLRVRALGGHPEHRRQEREERRAVAAIEVKRPADHARARTTAGGAGGTGGSPVTTAGVHRPRAREIVSASDVEERLWGGPWLVAEGVRPSAREHHDVSLHELDRASFLGDAQPAFAALDGVDGGGLTGRRLDRPRGGAFESAQDRAPELQRLDGRGEEVHFARTVDPARRAVHARARSHGEAAHPPFGPGRLSTNASNRSFASG